MVTGAGGGIGQASARRIAAEGGAVFCVDLNPAAVDATVDFGLYSRTMLNPGQQATVDVIVTGGDWADQDFLGDGGDLVIQIEGSSSAPTPTPPAGP